MVGIVTGFLKEAESLSNLPGVGKKTLIEFSGGSPLKAKEKAKELIEKGKMRKNLFQ